MARKSVAKAPEESIEAKLRRLAGAATNEYPWHMTVEPNQWPVIEFGGRDSDYGGFGIVGHYHPKNVADAEYIAAASPRNVLELLNEIDRLRAEAGK